MERSEYIGGSDIASVMGLSRWKTPLQLWAEKTGNIPQEDLSDKEYIVFTKVSVKFINVALVAGNSGANIKNLLSSAPKSINGHIANKMIKKEHQLFALFKIIYWF